MHGNGAPRDAVLNTWRSQEELGGLFLGHRVYLKAKARGENSMLEKTGGRPKTPRTLPCEARLIGRKLHCLNPNPQRGNAHPRRYGVSTRRYRKQIIRVSGSHQRKYMMPIPPANCRLKIVR